MGKRWGVWGGGRKGLAGGGGGGGVVGAKRMGESRV